VRNPLDAIVSLFNMACTGSHTNSIVDSDFKKFYNLFQMFLKNEISVWKDFHDFWLNSKIPVHLIRFEDILGNPKPTLMSLLSFILNESDLKGTVVEKYIDLAVAE
jgi:hypothetical protein